MFDLLQSCPFATLRWFHVISICWWESWWISKISPFRPLFSCPNVTSLSHTYHHSGKCRSSASTCYTNKTGETFFEDIIHLVIEWLKLTRIQNPKYSKLDLACTYSCYIYISFFITWLHVTFPWTSLAVQQPPWAFLFLLTEPWPYPCSSPEWHPVFGHGVKKIQPRFTGTW